MTSAQVRPRAKVGDIVATILLGGVGVTGGIFLGGLYLIFAPLAPSQVAWTIACLALMVVPVVTAVIGIVRLVQGRLGYWWPLIGLVFGAVLFVVLMLVGGSGREVIPADFG